MVEDLDRLQQLMTDVVSVRRWLPREIRTADLERLLVAFGSAPSSGQPWELYKLDSQSAREAAISATLEPLMTPGTEGAQKWLFEAPVAIVVCLELRRANARLGEAGREIAVQEIGGAIQNLRVMANAMGMRTAVVREFQKERMREALALPWFLEPMAIVAVGYSEAALEYPPRYAVQEFCRTYEPPATTETPSSTSGSVAATGASGCDAAPQPMGSVAEAIYGRRSVRRFTGEPLAPGTLEKLLDAARQAPSSGNMQPWEFVVLEAEEVRKLAVSTTFSGYFAGADNQQTWLMGASVIIATCVNRHRTAGRYGVRYEGHAVIDVGAAVQNLLLAATEMGLGTCWVGGFKAADLAEALGIPDGVQLISLIAVGPPAHNPGPRYRLPLDLVTHLDRWGNSFFQDNQRSRQ